MKIAQVQVIRKLSIMLIAFSLLKMSYLTKNQAFLIVPVQKKKIKIFVKYVLMPK